MRISELYGPVPQGEGALLGEPMPFVRVAGCNLSCSWCDSSYTWTKGYVYTEMTVAAVMAQLDQLRDGCRWVSITGGEPTIYDADVLALCKLLRRRRFSAIIETNGLRPIDAFTLSNVFVSCSPKLPGSGQDSAVRRAKVARLVVHRMSSARLRARTQFKFVIASPDDLAALPEYCASIGLPRDGSALIYVQPDGYVQPIAQYIAALGWLQRDAPHWVRVTPQVHRLVHGPDARSV